MTTDSKVLLAIVDESQRAHANYGNPTSAHESLGVLLEEMDELREAIHDNSGARTYDEAVQVASVAYRLALAIESCDPAFFHRSGFAVREPDLFAK